MDERRLPDMPTAGSALRGALSGFYYNSWRLAPANAVWGLALVITIFLALAAPIAGLVAWLFLMPLPTAGIFRLAALIARDRPVTLSDAFAWRELARPALLAGLLVGGLSAVLGFNLVVGASSLDPVGWAFATLAGWGLLVVWLVALAVWPLLVDPEREGQPLEAKLRTAVTVILAVPLRYVALVLGLAGVIVASTILFAALLTVSVAFVALALSNYVLPLADRIEQRRTIVVTQ